MDADPVLVTHWRSTRSCPSSVPHSISWLRWRPLKGRALPSWRRPSTGSRRRLRHSPISRVSHSGAPVSRCRRLLRRFGPRCKNSGRIRAAALLPRNPVRLKRLRCVAPGLPRRSCGVDAPLREDGPRGTPDDAHPSAVQLPRAHCAGAGFGVECGRVSHRERERRRRRPDLQCCRGPDTRETLVKSKAT